MQKFNRKGAPDFELWWDCFFRLRLFLSMDELGAGNDTAIILPNLSSSCPSSWRLGRGRRRRRRLSLRPWYFGEWRTVISLVSCWTCGGHQVSDESACAYLELLVYSLLTYYHYHRRIFGSEFKGDVPSSSNQVLFVAPIGVDTIIPYRDTLQNHKLSTRTEDRVLQDRGPRHWYSGQLLRNII